MKGNIKQMKKVIATLILTAILLTSCGFEEIPDPTENAANANQSSTAATEPTTPPATEVPPPPPPPEFQRVSFLAAGDNLVHTPIFTQGAKHGKARDMTYDFEPIYGRVADLISAADLSVINQETLVNALYPPATFPHFSSPVELGDYMIEMGFDVFALANNHTMDLKMDGLFASLDYWDSRMETHSNVVAVGAYRDPEDRAVIRTSEVNDVTFSYLSYAESLNGLHSWLKPPAEVGRTEPIDIVLAEIAAAKAVSDVCVVFLHWGAENSSTIHASQRTYAQRLVDAGADIIIGTHPHVLRDIEWYTRTSDGSPAIVAYSLGNFIGAQKIPQTMIGGLLKFDIVVDYSTRAISFEDAHFVPTITHYDRGFANIRIYPLSDYTAETAQTHGVREHGRFDLAYINEILEKTLADEWLR